MRSALCALRYFPKENNFSSNCDFMISPSILSLPEVYACTVEAGAHAKPQCTLKMAAADFLAMMKGSLQAMQAYASGKLKIEGDIMKSQLLVKLFKLG